MKDISSGGKLGTGADKTTSLKGGSGFASLKTKAKARKKTTADSLGQVIAAKPKVTKTGNRPAAPSKPSTGKLGGGGKL